MRQPPQVTASNPANWQPTHGIELDREINYLESHLRFYTREWKCSDGMNRDTFGLVPTSEHAMVPVGWLATLRQLLRDYQTLQSIRDKLWDAFRDHASKEIDFAAKCAANQIETYKRECAELGELKSQNKSLREQLEAQDALIARLHAKTSTKDTP